MADPDSSGGAGVQDSEAKANEQSLKVDESDEKYSPREIGAKASTLHRTKRAFIWCFNGSLGHFHPYNEFEKRTRLGGYQPSRFSRLFDKVGLKIAQPPPEELPRTWVGGCCSIVFGIFIIVLLATSINQFFHPNILVTSGTPVVINIDCVDDNPGMNPRDLAACKYPYEVLLSSQPSFLVQLQDLAGVADPRPWDLPVMNFEIENTIDFYERDQKTSLHKFQVVDFQSLSPAFTNTNSTTPATASAQESMQTPLGSFHEITGVIEPAFKSNVKTLMSMGRSSGSHMFDQTMMYWMQLRDVFDSGLAFFDHTVSLYVRFATEQLQSLKNCQLQISLVNDALLAPVMSVLKEDRKLFDTFKFFKTGSFSWMPSNWDPTTLKFAPQADPLVTANMINLEATLSFEEVLNFFGTTDFGSEHEQNVGITQVNSVNIDRAVTDVTNTCEFYDMCTSCSTPEKCPCQACSACLWYSGGKTRNGTNGLPCKNNGKCIDSSLFTYVCTCEVGFSGRYCEIRESSIPTEIPTQAPPTALPTASPTRNPTSQPTFGPSAIPTYFPTLNASAPTQAPSRTPTSKPSANPTSPTASPTRDPTMPPSEVPTGLPTFTPTLSPSLAPTALPTDAGATWQPTGGPTFPPPTQLPSAMPTMAPTSDHSPLICGNSTTPNSFPLNKYKCFCKTGQKLVMEGAFGEVLMRWGVLVNYVVNFNYSFTELTCANSDGSIKTPTSFSRFNTEFKKAIAPDAKSSVVVIPANSVGAGFTKKAPFYILVSGLAGVERMAVIDLVMNQATNYSLNLIVARGPQVADQALNFKISMPTMPRPSTPSAEWNCHPMLYNDQVSCDCRCGLPDPDCVFPNLPIKNCGSGEVCSALGRCTLPLAASGLTDTSEVYISELCGHLMKPGNTELVGFFGSDALYRSLGADHCYTCPNERPSLYGGAASLSEVCTPGVGCVGAYVCRYKAEGYIDARNVIAFDAELTSLGETFDIAKGGWSTVGQNATNTYRWALVKNGGRSPFPSGSGGYTIGMDELCDGAACGNMEIVRVTWTGPPDEGNRQAVKLEAISTSGFKQQHFSYGTLLSALGEDSMDMIVQLTAQEHHFPISGPFLAQIDSTPIVFQQSSDSQALLKQRVAMSKQLPLKAGVRTTVVRDLDANMNPDVALSPRHRGKDPWPSYSNVTPSDNITRADPWPNVTISDLSNFIRGLQAIGTVDLDPGRAQAMPCVEAYTSADHPTVRWLGDARDGSWKSLFGSNFIPNTGTPGVGTLSPSWCDGIHDGHLIVNNAGFEAAVALASAKNISLQVVIRGSQANMQLVDVRTVKMAWPVQFPVWVPEDQDNCYSIPADMTADHPCSCKSECLCYPGCNENDCNKSSRTRRPTCPAFLVTEPIVPRIQPKGTLKWMPERWGCPSGNGSMPVVDGNLSSFFGDGYVCDCGCGRYDPDCASTDNSPKNHALALSSPKFRLGQVRNYCTDSTTPLGSNGRNLTDVTPAEDVTNQACSVTCWNLTAGTNKSMQARLRDSQVPIFVAQAGQRNQLKNTGFMSQDEFNSSTIELLSLSLRVKSGNNTMLDAGYSSSKWYMTVQYLMTAGNTLVERNNCPKFVQNLFSTNQSHWQSERVAVFVDDVYSHQITLYATPNINCTEPHATDRCSFTSSAWLSLEFNKTNDISVKNSSEFNLKLVFLDAAPKIQNASNNTRSFFFNNFNFFPACDVAMKNTNVYRYCTTSDYKPTAFLDMIKRERLFTYESMNLEVLALEQPVNKKRDRGTIVETVVSTVNMTDENPFNISDPALLNLSLFGYKSVLGRRLLAWGHQEAPLDSTQEGSKLDLRMHTSHHTKPPGSVHDVWSKIVRADTVGPTLTGIEFFPRSWALHLRFDEPHVRVTTKSYETIKLFVRHPEKSVEDMYNLSTWGGRHGQVNPAPDTCVLTMNIHRELQRSGCADFVDEYSCDISLEFPFAVFEDPRGNPSSAAVFSIKQVGPFETSRIRRLRRMQSRVQGIVTLSSRGIDDVTTPRRLGRQKGGLASYLFRKLDINVDGELSARELWEVTTEYVRDGFFLRRLTATEASTEAPTEAPVATEAPAEAPTGAGSTEAPSEAPAEAPTEAVPTSAGPTEAPSEAATEAPTEAEPTEPPSEEPTEAPTWAPTNQFDQTLSMEWRECDANGDGTISITELKTLIAKGFCKYTNPTEAPTYKTFDPHCMFNCSYDGSCYIYTKKCGTTTTTTGDNNNNNDNGGKNDYYSRSVSYYQYKSYSYSYSQNNDYYISHRDSSDNSQCTQCSSRRLEASPEKSGKDAMRRLQRPPLSSRNLQDALPCCEVFPDPNSYIQSNDGYLMQAAGDIKNPCQPWEVFDPIALQSHDYEVTQTRGCIVGMCKTSNTKPDSNRVCSSLTDSEVTALYDTNEVSTSLKLTSLPVDYAIDDVLKAGSAQDQFLSDLIEELAMVMKIPTEMFQVNSVQEGSVIVNFKIVRLTLEQRDAIGSDPAPTLVLDTLNALRSNVNLAAPESLLGYTDPFFGGSDTEKDVASTGTSTEALLSSLSGDKLDLVPPKVIDNPLLYSLSKIGIANREKASEYLPGNRAKLTQDEKWESPDKINLDIAIFVSPERLPIVPEHFCTIGGVAGDPVVARYLSGAASLDSAQASLMMVDFSTWILPATRRMNVDRCSVGDWLEIQQLKKGVRKESINVTSRALGEVSCGVADQVWVNTTCRDISFISQNYPNEYMRVCNRELFPSAEFKYTVSAPLNGKWLMRAPRLESTTYTAEWQLDIGMNYFFTWSSIDDETERLFKQGEPPGGDSQLINDPVRCNALGSVTTPCLERMLYTGRMSYKGQHAGDNKKTVQSVGIALHQIPATSPDNRLSFVLRLDHELTKRIVSRAHPDDWAEDGELDLILQCNDFERRTLDMDDTCRKNHVPSPVFPFHVDLTAAMSQVSTALDGSMSLEPGTLVTFEVALVIQPKYKQLDNWLAPQRLVTWTIGVQQIQATKTRPLPFNKRNQGQVRVKVSVDSRARQVIEKYSFTLIDFITRAGSWAGIWGFASLLVAIIFKIFRPFGVLGPTDADVLIDQVQDRYDEKLERRRKHAVADIKARLEKKHRGAEIDEAKVASLIVEQDHTVGLLNKTPLEDLLVTEGDDAGHALPDHIVHLLNDLDVES